MFVKLIAIVLILFSCNTPPGETPSASDTQTRRSGKTANKRVIAFTGFSPSIYFWDRLGKAIQQQGQKRDILTPIYPVENSREQMRVIRKAIKDGVDGLIIGPISETILPVISEAERAKIPVITVDAPLKHPWITAHIGTDNFKAGNLAGKLIAKQLKANTGAILIITGDREQNNARTRAEGAASALKNRKIIIHYAKNWSGREALKYLFQEIPQKNPKKIAAIFTTFAHSTIAMVAYQKTVSDTSMFNIGFDIDHQIKKLIISGELPAVIAQNPHRMGKLGVDLMLDHLKGKKIPEKIDIPAAVVTDSNAKDY